MEPMATAGAYEMMENSATGMCPRCGYSTTQTVSRTREDISAALKTKCSARKILSTPIGLVSGLLCAFPLSLPLIYLIALKIVD